MAAGLAAMVTPVAAGAAAPEEELRYDGRMSSPSLVLDGSGNGLHGAVLSANGGAVTSLAEPRAGRVLRFPSGSCEVAPCPQAVIAPAGSDRLVGDDGGTGAFAFGAAIRLAEEPSAVAGMNVMQFGAAVAGQHQWKLQVDYGYPSCRWSDGIRTVLLSAAPKLPAPLQPDVWYEVRCARLSATLFELRVLDGATEQPILPAIQQTADLGAILPTGTAMIGGKVANAAQIDAATDQFHGDLDQIVFTRG